MTARDVAASIVEKYARPPKGVRLNRQTATRMTEEIAKAIEAGREAERTKLREAVEIVQRLVNAFVCIDLPADPFERERIYSATRPATAWIADSAIALMTPQEQTRNEQAAWSHFDSAPLKSAGVALRVEKIQTVVPGIDYDAETDALGREPE